MAVEDTPQWAYRAPGEPQVHGTTAYEESLGQSAFPEHGSRVKTRTESGLSEFAGYSPPMTLLQRDLENAWDREQGT